MSGSRDFQLIELPAGQKTRAVVELERSWKCCTVAYIPYTANSIRESAFDDGPNFLLHLSQGDAGIPIRQVGQKIRADFGNRVWWTSRYNYGLPYHQIILIFSDAVGVDFSGTDRLGYWKADQPTATYAYHLSSADNNDPTNVGPVIRGAASFVKDGANWRALTPSDFGGAAAASPASIVAGQTGVVVSGSYSAAIVTAGPAEQIRLFSLRAGIQFATAPAIVRARIGASTVIAEELTLANEMRPLLEHPAGILLGALGDDLYLGQQTAAGNQVIYYTATYTLE